MSADLRTLIDSFRLPFLRTLSRMEKEGYVLKITYTLRTPLEQAKLWRQGRPRSVINARTSDLEALGCDYLAQCLKDAGPQSGKKVTNALPGLSWHQYGEAADVLAYDTTGTLIKNGDNIAYQILEDMARKEGLTTGRSWGDAGHIQASQLGKPQYDLPTINDLMKNKFLTNGKD